MSSAIETEQELTEEAISILQKSLPPHKVARLLSIWRVGQGDHVKERGALFASGNGIKLQLTSHSPLTGPAGLLQCFHHIIERRIGNSNQIFNVENA